jgi:hypothetical protein
MGPNGITLGAGGKLIHEKNQKQKSRDTVPLKALKNKVKSFKYKQKWPGN